MPGAVRKGDVDNDVDTIVSGSDDVLTNGRPAVRIGDVDNDVDTIVSGSRNVLING